MRDPVVDAEVDVPVRCVPGSPVERSLVIGLRFPRSVKVILHQVVKIDDLIHFVDVLTFKKIVNKL